MHSNDIRPYCRNHGSGLTETVPQRLLSTCKQKRDLLRRKIEVLHRTKCAQFKIEPRSLRSGDRTLGIGAVRCRGIEFLSVRFVLDIDFIDQSSALFSCKFLRVLRILRILRVLAFFLHVFLHVQLRSVLLCKISSIDKLKKQDSRKNTIY